MSAGSSAGKLSVRALGALAVGTGLFLSVVGCQSESAEETPTTTETTETTSPAPETEPSLAPTTKGSLDPVAPGPGHKGKTY